MKILGQWTIKIENTNKDLREIINEQKEGINEKFEENNKQINEKIYSIKESTSDTLRQTINTVSYTHLDVYKRQVLNFL